MCVCVCVCVVMILTKEQNIIICKHNKWRCTVGQKRNKYRDEETYFIVIYYGCIMQY